GHLLRDPGALHGMQAALAQPFDGDDSLAGRLAHRQRARPHRRAVEVHGAGATGRDTTAELGADDVQILPQDPEQRVVGRRVVLAFLAVDGESNHRSMKVSPSTSTSILVRRKQSIASSGLHTTGSFSLKLVLSTIGTPVMALNASIRRAYLGFPAQV